MNDPQLEARLRSLRPARLSPALTARLLAAPPFSPRVEPKVPWVFFAAPPFALAAILFFVAMIDALSPARYSSPSPSRPRLAVHHRAVSRARGPRPSDFRVFLPVAQHSTLLSVSPGIVVDAGPARPLRLLQARWLDDTVYLGNDHSTLHRRTTRSEIIPVAFNAL